MNLWGAAPLLVAALLGGGTGAHTVTVHSTIQRGAAHAKGSPAATPAPSVAAASTPSPVLSQIGSSRQWKTTLLLNANTAACKHVATSYWLETTPPGTAISGTATPAWQAGTARQNGSSCGVTVTFTGVSGIPKTAALILDEAGASSSIPLTVSRHVTVFDYLWIPAIAGAVVAVLALIGSLFAVSIYSPDGRRLNFRHRDFWARPILASSAWTLNDSWATNITTVISVIGTVLGTTTAVTAFFPGVAVDRFVIVNIIAGGIIAVSPLIFAIFYALWIGRNPGVTGDATLLLPPSTTLMATLPAAPVTLPKGTTVLLPSGGTGRLPVDTRVGLASATPALLAAGSSVRLTATAQATLPAGTQAALLAGTAVRFGGRWPAWLAAPAKLTERTQVRFPSGGRAALPANTLVRLAGGGPATLPAVSTRASLRARAQVRLRDGRAGFLARATDIELPEAAAIQLPDDAAAVTLPTRARVGASAGWPATLPDGATVTLPPDAARRIGVAAGTQVTVLPGAVARLDAGATAQAASVAEGPPVTIGVVSGAKITVPGGAIVTARGGDAPPARQVKAGQTILVPPASYIGVAAGASMSLPGDTNITVPGRSTLTIGGSARSLTISGDDLIPLAAPPAHAASQAAASRAAPNGQPAGENDAYFPYPVRIAAAGGAEISVTGTADFSLPRDTVITAPLRAVSVLPRDRDLQVPQGSDMIAANLKLILVSLAVTMFGIGAELGLIGVLVLGFSEASTTGLAVMGAAMLVVALGALVYAVTATRTLANPQPGSSMSATSGTSFTL